MTEKKEKFGLFSIVLLGINSIIGTGIFLLPNRAYALMGPASLGILLFDAFLAGALALCFAEAAGFFSRNGGPYLYAKAAFGDFWGYEIGVLKLVVTIIAWAAMAVGFATALGAAFPAFSGEQAKDIIAAVLIGGLSALNIAGVKTTKYLNNILTVSKLVPLVLFIALGIFFLNGSNFTPFVPAHLEEGAFANAAITMFIVGTILADVPLLTIFNRDSILYSILRLILLPGLAWGVSAALGLDAVATGIAVLMTGMPAGATTAIFAARYGSDAPFATKLTVLSTLLSIFTILFWCLLLPKP